MWCGDMNLVLGDMSHFTVIIDLHVSAERSCN